MYREHFCAKHSKEGRLFILWRSSNKYYDEETIKGFNFRSVNSCERGDYSARNEKERDESG